MRLAAFLAVVLSFCAGCGDDTLSQTSYSSETTVSLGDLSGQGGGGLGLGVQAPLASWGSLAADGIQNLAVFPWQLICPGLTMAVTLFSLNFLGDGLRDALDPQMRKG